MYGCPGRVEELKELVAVMKEKGLGNGFDPGPPARASSRPLFEYLATVGWPIICYPGWSDMQVMDGRSRLTDGDEEALKVLDRAAVFNAYDLLEQQLFPGSDHIHARPSPDNPEASYLRPTPYGEMFDVLLSNAPADVLKTYPALILMGDMEFDRSLVDRLVEAVSAGSRRFLHPRHAKTLGKELDLLKAAGSVEAPETVVNPTTGRPAAIAPKRLAQLTEELLPVVVEGDRIQYQVNRNRQGWVVELVHNGGIAKKPDQPSVVDPKARARVVPAHPLRNSSTSLSVLPPSWWGR
jgi:hypothetical protein